MDLHTDNSTIHEKRVIGGIISGVIKPSAITLTPSDLKEFGAVLTACRELESEKLDITADAVYHRIIAKDRDDLFYTAEDYRLFGQMASSGAAVYESVNKIKSTALRSYLNAGLAEILSSDTLSGAAILDRLKAMVAVADSDYRTNENNFVFLSEIVPKLEAIYDDFHSGVSYAVATGFPCLDETLLDGFSKGDLHVIVGLTGHGKSALALNCARYQAMQGIVVGVVSREMADTENAMRLQASMQQIPRWQMKRGIYDQTYRELKHGVSDLAKLPIAFDVRTTTIDGLKLQTKQMVEQFEMKILYVDYLQLVSIGRSRGSRSEDVAAISRGLKEIAMENNIPVVALSQFSRAAITADVTELLGCLKESSGIEQDASTVTYIQVDNSDPSAEKKAAKIYVLKNRNGATLKPIMYQYFGATFTFTEDGYGAI